MDESTEESKQIPQALLDQLPTPDENGMRLACQDAAITMPGGITVRISVVPKWIEEARSGDHLMATAILALPAGDDNYLHNSLQFQGRCSVFLQPLLNIWGTLDDDGFRRMQNTIGGETWIEAIRDAESFLIKEVARLWRALAARHKAMRSEGWEYLAKANLLDAARRRRAQTESELIPPVESDLPF